MDVCGAGRNCHSITAEFLLMMRKSLKAQSKSCEPCREGRASRKCAYCNRSQALPRVLRFSFLNSFLCSDPSVQVGYPVSSTSSPEHQIDGKGGRQDGLSDTNEFSPVR